MIDLTTIQSYFASDAVFVTEHAMERLSKEAFLCAMFEVLSFRVRLSNNIPMIFHFQAA